MLRCYVDICLHKPGLLVQAKAKQQSISMTAVMQLINTSTLGLLHSCDFLSLTGALASPPAAGRTDSLLLNIKAGIMP